MNKRLAGLAVAAILAAPSLGLADSSHESSSPALGLSLPGIATPTTAGSTGLVAAVPTPTPGVPLVAAEKLIPLLPAPPAGWSAEKPQGSTGDTDDLKIATAQRSYHQGDADEPPTASVTIIDFAKNQSYMDAITTAWQLKAETPDGYDKPVEIDGIRGFEHYARPLESSSLAVIVAGRFFIQIELTKTAPKELREWLKRIDLKQLAGLK